MLIVFCVERPNEEGASIGRGIELCGCSSRQRQQQPTLFSKRSTSHSYKDPSLNRNIGKLRIPSVFNKLLKPHTQLELPNSYIPPGRASSSLGLSTQKTINTSHLLDPHLQLKCHAYDHTFQTSRQWNLNISTCKEIHRKTVFTHQKVSSSPKHI